RPQEYIEGLYRGSDLDFLSWSANFRKSRSDPSMNRRPGRAADQRRPDGECHMTSFAAACRERQDDHRKPAGTKGQAGSDAVAEISGITDILLTLERHLALLGRQPDADGPGPQRMLDALLEQEQMRTTEAVVVVAREQPLAVDVGAAERPLEVERDDAVRSDAGSRDQHTEADSASAVARHGRASVNRWIDRALVRRVRVADHRGGPGIPVQRYLV